MISHDTHEKVIDQRDRCSSGLDERDVPDVVLDVKSRSFEMRPRRDVVPDRYMAITVPGEEQGTSRDRSERCLDIERVHRARRTFDMNRAI